MPASLHTVLEPNIRISCSGKMEWLSGRKAEYLFIKLRLL